MGLYIFWLSLITLLYIYFGYPLYVFIKSTVSSGRIDKDINYKPSVSVIFSAYNEERLIQKKIDNLLNSAYPADKLEILVGSDGSTDGTNKILSQILNSRVKPFIFPERRGKVNVLNKLAPKAKGDILVFCDTRQVFDADAISNLAVNFNDKKIGCVSGNLLFLDSSKDNGMSKGAWVYLKYERFIRNCESAAHSMVGAAGAIYAIRKDLYSPPPKDTILDDVYIPLSIVRRGFRSIFDSTAKAYDMPASTSMVEYRRKARTLAGNYQIFSMFGDLFIPFKSPVSLQLISHKLLRVLAPFFMVALLISNIFIVSKDYYGLFLISQVFFYVLAMVGAITYKNKNKKLFIRFASTIYVFCLMNFTALVGLYRYIFKKQDIAWER